MDRDFPSNNSAALTGRAAISEMTAALVKARQGTEIGVDQIDNGLAGGLIERRFACRHIGQSSHPGIKFDQATLLALLFADIGGNAADGIDVSVVIVQRHFD